jgi:ribosomal protein S18 acetylase RimI-like enzyme
MELKPPFRAATPTDATALAAFVNMAGEGLPLYLWSKMAKPGEDAWQVGEERARREEASFSYRNAILFDVDGVPVSCLIGYKLPDRPEPIDYATMPPMFVPLQELENLAPSTWYVNVLATLPEHRSKGHGAALLALADRIAADHACRGLSIIVSGANTGARKLYERSGYRQVAERPMVKEDWENSGATWVLLTKRL